MGVLCVFRGKQGGNPTLSDKLVDHLNEVDEKYMRAFSTRSMREVSDNLSRECAIKVSRSVFAVGSNRYFGAPKFRKTFWTAVSRCGDVLQVMKDVHFDSVRVGSTLSIGVAADYKEVWTVDVSGSRPIVTDISGA